MEAKLIKNPLSRHPLKDEEPEEKKGTQKMGGNVGPGNMVH